MEPLRETVTYNKWSKRNFRREQTYRYYDTPDGHDLLQKLWYMAKNTTLTGLLIGGYGAYVLEKPGAPRHLWLFDAVRYTLPFVLSGSTYVVTTYAATKIRGKDDELNSGLGGIAAGLIFGSYFRKPSVALLGASVLCMAACMKKSSVMAGHRWPDKLIDHEGKSSWVLRNLDFCPKGNYEGNWTTVKPEKPPPPPTPPPPPPPPTSICSAFE